MYKPKVFDIRPTGHSSFGVLPKLGENDYDQLQAFYKFEMDFTYGFDRALSGERWFGIYAIELKAGPAVFQPQVQNEDGSLITTPPGVLLFNHWPGAPELNFAPEPPYHTNAVAGFTGGEGTLGWGYGPDDHIGDNGGVHSFWASSDPPTAPNRRVGSEAIKKVGWWDDHITPNPIFRVMVKSGGTPVGESRLVVYDAAGNQVGYVSLVTGNGTGGRIALVQGGLETAHVVLS